MESLIGIGCISTPLHASSPMPKFEENVTLPGPAEDALTLLWQELKNNPPASGSTSTNPESFSSEDLPPPKATTPDLATFGRVSEEGAPITTLNGTHLPPQLRATSVSASSSDRKTSSRICEVELGPIHQNRKRPASLPPSPEKLRPHPFTQASRRCTNFTQTPSAIISGPSNRLDLSPNHGFTQDQIPRGSTHLECTSGKPCRHPLHWTPPPNDANVVIYASTLYFGRGTTVDEAEYILSRCDCYWASKFSLMWARWCQMTGDEALQRLTKAEWLLEGFHNQLMLAAGNCCPTGKPVVIVLDQ